VAVHVEKRGPVTTIVLDRPEARNAIDRAHAEALSDAVRAFEVDPAAHVAVLWGAGGHFCAGADLKAIAAGAPNRVAPTGDGPLGPTRLRTSKPVIAAIAGFAVAGGLELAIWCDLRVVEASATLGVFCRRWGVPLIDGGTVRLPRLIGQGRALDLILTGRPVGADEALRIGLADRVVPDGKSREAAEALAHEIAAHPQACLRSDRASAIDQWSLPEAIALRSELDHGLRSLAEGAIEGARAFAATRQPDPPDPPDPEPDREPNQRRR
jgi:enoyl-CoA hydratase